MVPGTVKQGYLTKSPPLEGSTAVFKVITIANILSIIIDQSHSFMLSHQYYHTIINTPTIISNTVYV